ncbi:MAG: hypothetical protein ACD_52C00151G0005 [uncultured bacterium]|uniref:Metallo-beta-lactamase domain-containing protein n=1 Tax=Candidatus Woesebacteria bacterium RIFCSPHIGHO2_12_FULL_41_24 TaxID=1802510 RepID=A0A1F8AU15_9BACT|nr:MAG: hypothetical protein ACD_52C00151G0005 [uncultured bacterium]OGM14169.1 MAG: hypothetical protein A2W15_03820 [Candidatus Woesebacteria bacterium RBG_16_41_13]OGM28546.1 MAG: hypothetical protein A2873_02800 [Candidatus Woesebacteria bacterium RIFCSPHIGHO2_01_FULL_42_80]OGM35632.1 MAG: hypothetical protein A3D84_03670 [Candidatus Woesebacteria bacterium RIFCSPHIGHO2_02_FULL_42_20]OGM55243.1 MAG: hypothetical protein A3E44_03080 [Candidatus Woesebacteria bacterium RIFCSPHIGHO2_12_FULL_41
MSELKFIVISGTTGVTENCYIYQWQEEMMVVDCGVGFPDPEMLGVDLVIPDFTYIKKNKDKLRGILISHGHEDHLGALPFLFRDVDVPIYATKLVAGFIEDKFADYGLKPPRITVFNPERDAFAVGVFKINPFRVSHSVPDGVGYAIDTPAGRVFHVPDYKFDWTPVDGRPFDIARAAMLASGGVLALASDSLGSTTEGYTKSEKEIETKVETIARDAKKKILFTTISSNISRIKQALNVAAKLRRKVVIVGRSIEKKVEIAQRLGYLDFDKHLLILPKEAKRFRDSQLFFIISGSYGQIGSALYRVAISDHQFIRVSEDDVVIFSGDPAPPGSKDNVDFVVDRLIELGVDVHYYDTQEDLHVSGHGSREDINTLFGLVRPKYFIPIGGTIRHNKAYKRMAMDFGANEHSVFELKGGNILELGENGAFVLPEKIPSRSVMVDGLGVGDVGNIVLRDRSVLATDGVAIAVIELNKDTKKLSNTPDIISRGFVYKGAKESLLKDAGFALKAELERMKELDQKLARNVAADFLERYFNKKIARRPMILPVIVEV